jgi:hypothetical protein
LEKSSKGVITSTKTQATGSVHFIAPSTESIGIISSTDGMSGGLFSRFSRPQGPERESGGLSPEIVPRDFAAVFQQETNNNCSWIILCFSSADFGAKAIPEDITGGRFDSEIFTRFRQLYFTERSWMGRFFELKEVKKISIVNVSMLKICSNLKH